MDVVAHESASVMVGVCTAIPEWMRAHTLELSKLHVPEEDRRKGYASALLKLVCEQADATGKTLLLTVKPYDDMSLSGEQLRDWYARFGFIEIQVEPCLMARMPGSGPRALH